MIINKTDTFFMAACMAASHTFICIGVQQNNGECKMLLDVGKAMPKDTRDRNILSTFFLMLLGKLPADIMNEGKLVNGVIDHIEHHINYTAYEINLTQYQQLLTVLKRLNPRINAFVPMSDTETTISFAYQALETYCETDLKVTLDVDRLNEHQHALSFQNNCRDAALVMTRLTLPEHVDTAFSLPTFFLKSFPCSNSIRNS